MSKNVQKCSKVSKRAYKCPTGSKKVQKGLKRVQTIPNKKSQKCPKNVQKCPKMCLRNIWMPPKVQKHSRAQRTHEASWRLLQEGCGRKEAGRNGKYQSFENSRSQLYCPTKSNTNYISNSSQCKKIDKLIS